MKLNLANASKSKAVLYVEALGGKKNGKIPDFDNHVDESIIPITVNKRARPTHYTGSTSTDLNQDRISFTVTEVRELCAEKDQ
jgi:hypothetical protein